MLVRLVCLQVSETESAKLGRGRQSESIGSSLAPKGARVSLAEGREENWKSVPLSRDCSSLSLLIAPASVEPAFLVSHSTDHVEGRPPELSSVHSPEPQSPC